MKLTRKLRNELEEIANTLAEIRTRPHVMGLIEPADPLERAAATHKAYQDLGIAIQRLVLFYQNA